MYFSIEEIDRLIKEDVPYLDLTSWSLGIHDQPGKISYLTREDGIVCATEEVAAIFDRLRIRLDEMVPSGTKVKPGDCLISGTGRGADINMAWKVGQNLLEHCSGIATKTRRMLDNARAVNQKIGIFTTRKGFPGTKSLTIKSILAGGAMPHRLGLSETFLVFRQHIDYIGGVEALIAKMPLLKSSCGGKKIVVEAEDYEFAKLLSAAGVDGIQFDKVKPEILTEICQKMRTEFPNIMLLATGGITEENAAAYAQTGVDGLVTTNLYVAKPVDIKVIITPV